VRWNEHISVAVSLCALTLLIVPSDGYAQRRRGRVRVVAPSVVAGGYYYRSYDPFWSYDPWWGPWHGSAGYYGARYIAESSIRLQVTPRETEVYVDGYLVGTVDDFDGFAQRLRVDPGDHVIELYLEGHRAISQAMMLQPGESYRIRHAMEPLQAGEAPAARPLPRATGGAPPPPSPGETAGRRAPPPNAGRMRGGAPQGAGTLAIRVRPSDAVVLIDGERWEGSADGAPLQIQVAPGAHRIQVQKEGYEPFTTTVHVRPGDQTPLNVSLTRRQQEGA
jgi:hypothetical protein